MQTQLSPEFRNSTLAAEAGDILRACVHCGFCNATCPTYQLLGDELDGPRGRIYLIKQLLEGVEVGRSTQEHLDRCLTCLNCETTCPSGVQYGRLASIGRGLVDARVERPTAQRVRRWLLREGLTSRWFAPLMRLARLCAGVLPARLAAGLPRRAERGEAQWPTATHARKVILLRGCVQPALMPNVNAATARVLDAAGIETLIVDGAGCCGALRDHLSDPAGGLADARRNIDAWWPWVETGSVEAIVMNASACGLAVKQYGEAMQRDAAYAAKAARISSLARDLGELLPDLVPALTAKMRDRTTQRLAMHAPCTLQHGQRLRGGIEAHLAQLGFDVRVAGADNHLCCGSAGTYSVLQPELATRLRDRKLAQLTRLDPQWIVSSNVGCIRHLQSGTTIPVRHWVELVDWSLRG